MSDPLESALVELGRRFMHAVVQDAELRQSLRDVARALLQEPDAGAVPGEAAAIADPAPVPEVQEAPRDAAPRLPDLSGALEKLSAHYGDGGERDFAAVPERGSALPVEVAAPSDEPTGEGPPPHLLESIAEACRLKSEAIDALLETAGDAPEAAQARAEHMQRLAPRGRALPDGDLWMLRVQGPAPEQLETWSLIGAAYAELAEALAWLHLMVTTQADDKDSVSGGLHRVAAAQSALRSACQRVGQTAEATQLRAFTWLREFASERRFYIGRHMRENDRADPARSRERMAAVRAERAALELALSRKKDRGKSLNKVRYHANKLLKARGEEVLPEWSTIAAAVADLIEDGLPPSNKQLREYLLPVVETLPDALEETPELDLVLREMDRYLANVRVPESTEAACPVANADIEQARRLLAGQPVVLIGGDSRPQAKAALEERLGISELIWLSSRPHQSIADFKPYIQRDDVALVLLAIRWSSHSFGDVKDFCDEVGKPLVRLPAGYHPNQVARQIIEQASQRLAA
jgi:hypothetical protein